jgi:hypothetical protein
MSQYTESYKYKNEMIQSGKSSDKMLRWQNEFLIFVAMNERFKNFHLLIFSHRWTHYLEIYLVTVIASDNKTRYSYVEVKIKNSQYEKNNLFWRFTKLKISSIEYSIYPFLKKNIIDEQENGRMILRLFFFISRKLKTIKFKWNRKNYSSFCLVSNDDEPLWNEEEWS